MNVSIADKKTHQRFVGLGLAGLIVAMWAILHVYCIFFLQLTGARWFAAPFLVAMQAWLYVGVFIVAHDAIHGSLALGWPRLNRIIGQVCVGLYAGFSYRRLADGHSGHHAAPGTARDPDFDADSPHGFSAWFVKFFLTYFSMYEMTIMTLWASFYIFILHANVMNLIVFWAMPALLSAIQLFVFGTWLPHRHQSSPFVDEHRARSSGFGWLASLLTCFHFGYHHEHHTEPQLPWWRLPAARRRAKLL
jgi:beta-carotene ketolase (CrtW type)